MLAPQGEIDLRLRRLLLSADHENLRRYLKELLPAEIGESLESFDNEQRKALLTLLEADRAAEVFGGLEERIQEEMWNLLSDEEISKLLEEMESDEAADVLRLLDQEERARVLGLLRDETARELRELLRHEEDTAGDLMMVELAALPETAILAEAIEHLRENQEEIRQLFNVYLVDDSRRLVGSLALRDMVLARPGMPLKALMEPIHVTATPGMDQEEVARLFRKYDLVSLPVVNEENVLVGRITVDDIMEVMEEEATEDLSRFAGVSEPGFHAGTLFRLSFARLPWLLLGLLGGLLSARILQGFEGSLSRVLELAFFVPVIMALAGNIGIQSSTIIVRGMATGEFERQATLRLLLRETGVSLVNGLLIGLLSWLSVSLWLGRPVLGALVSVSMVLVVLWATLTGTLIPLVLRRLGIDPAYATGPFVTTSNDIVALSFYLLISWRFLHLL